MASVRWAGVEPTSVDLAGSTPCAAGERERESRSGGRHQQTGGPAGCGHSAALDRPGTSAGEGGGGGVERLAAAIRVPVVDQVGSGGRGPRQRSRQPGSSSAAAPTKTPARPDPGARSNGTCSTAGPALVGRRRLELAERAHLRGRREQALFLLRRLAQLVRRRQRAEALEQPLDHVHLRLRERGVEPDAAGRNAVPSRRLDHVAPRRAGEVRVVEDDPRAPDASCSSSASASSRSDPPRSSRLRRR